MFALLKVFERFRCAPFLVARSVRSNASLAGSTSQRPPRVREHVRSSTHAPNILPCAPDCPVLGARNRDWEKKQEPCGNLFKMSVEGNRREAYCVSKEGVQCLTLISSSSIKSLSISDEKLGGPWVGGRRRMGGGDARVPAPAQWVNPSITESPLPASKAKRLPEELSSNPGSSRLCSCACVP